MCSLMYAVNQIGPNMRRLRHLADMSAADLARALNISKVYVGRMERGEKTPSVARLIGIVHALGCTPNELLVDCGRGAL